ncbi:putative transcription factor interactor and regulator FHA-SMAD family [Helianthus annuus]|uniref:Forkhead-associated (FHA) domain, SMAD/FHA domain superfamily n=1 Tax=Helianthus annuus TaxID=4232 RepID=A0A251T9E8_HELAN|nr:FHA domain-containing protein At4g14490 [Helianthus annuus]KAF5806207.1 putative forkhead-associated (FHA) domain, SMAD/FHA domain superfamily [Helianthus annuus]KAJ0570507.1 putative transcription factor interactor and regulator FHA-SMAD family [Helianthus annuus]KAJ0584854.1 putative transcription factor interactor and regulator FHA-SMAD family [Helianthus annuus]KAJ0919278.1 putative transcription factor interactor and regulator FHA-SMAD family [Helianthus annuus]KAJ0923047.1 putative tr
MEKTTTLKLIIEKGPRAGETLEYSSTSVIKIGRVVTGNTFAIKDSGISSKHLCIQFHNQWTLCDLDSSNGTLLNAQLLKPYAPSALNHGDRIKIGELTSILVNIQAQSMVPQRRNTRRRQGKCKPQSQLDDDVGELGLGFDVEKEGKQAVKKRNLRSAVKKDMDSSDRRILTSVKKEAVSFLVPEDVPENVDVSVQVEPKKTRGRRRKRTVEEVSVDADLDKRKAADVVVVGPVVGRMTRARRRLLLENAETGGLEKKLNNVDGSLQLGEVKDSGLGENLGVDDESAAENQECCDGKGVMADGSSLKGKGVVEESECMKDGGDNDRWKDLEKMTLGDFFDYLEVQLPKEIYDRSEKIISDLEEKARKCHEFRLQRNESGKGKLVTE